MRKLILAAVVAVIGILPLQSAPVQAQPETAVPTETKATGAFYPVAIGLGAIAGVAIYNMASFGVSGVPFLAPAVTTGAMVTAVAIAQNRLYTVTSGVVGAVIANWLYGN